MRSHSSSIGLSGSALKGEIELLDDPEKVAAILKKTGRDIGILYQDRYWIWINDPVRFPSGNMGVYGRILSRSSLEGYAGCAVVPRFKDGRIALNCNFRHATRSWELEIPRGFTEKGETAEESARREVFEETGFLAKDLVFLGEMPPDTGKSNAVVAIFMADIDERAEARPEESEAIASIVALTLSELREGLRKGSIPIKMQEKEIQVFVRDPFLTYALIQMEIRGLYSSGCFGISSIN
jgi:ADP-ribose pyrophosphatase